MARVAVVTDSNSGITQKEGKELGIRVVPMPFMIDGEEYLEDITLSQSQFYEMLVGETNVCTSQPSIGFVNSIWDEVLTEYDEIVYIPMSSGLSNSCESAMVSADAMYKGKVYVVNNQRISVTQRQSVIDALNLAKKGYSGSDIKNILEREKFNSDIFIMVDTLYYLKKGGRITPAAAALGGLLKLKPILLIKGEKLDKFRMRNRDVENAKKIMLAACKDCIDGYLSLNSPKPDFFLEIAYSGTDRTQAELFAKDIHEVYPDKEIVINPLSLSVSCHIGTGALAMAVCKSVPELEY